MSHIYIQESEIKRKHIIKNQPNVNDVSQYTFTADETTFNYNNSTSLPENKDEFQNKDLNVTANGDIVNEKIIERNLKDQRFSFIGIDKLLIEQVGTPSALKNVRVKMWMFSYKYIIDTLFFLPNTAEELEQLTVASSADRIFNYEAGDISFGEDLGNLSFIEGSRILYDLNGAEGDIKQDEFSHRDDTYNAGEMFPTYRTDSLLNYTEIIDEASYNPIYMVFELKADNATSNTNRNIRWQLFQVDNLDLFDSQGPKITKLTFDELYVEEFIKSGRGQDAALKITDFEVSINLSEQRTNTWTDSPETYEYEDYGYFAQFVSPLVPIAGFESHIDFDDTLNKELLLKITPKSQLDNLNPSGYNYNYTGSQSTHTNIYFPDYFPKQHIGIINNQTNNIYEDIYLDEYRSDVSEEIQEVASAPTKITFNFEIVSTDSNVYDDTNNMEILYNMSEDCYARDFYYFVIDWDDVDDTIKTLDDWLETRPTNLNQLLELQENNLYIVARHYQRYDNGSRVRIDRFDKKLENIYTTPGIKTIKTIMFSARKNQIGRWKLITSRFYLDIPSNQYPDFSEVGGDEYNTIPWPYTTPIIGGVDDNSRYKKSVQQALSSGNIGNTDIIDETFLIGDLQNDETGKSINFMDLEQVRYFNKSYDINSLLNISTIPFYDDFDYYDGGTTNTTFSEESSVGQIFISDNQDLDLKQSCLLELNTINLTDKSIYDSSGNSNKGLLIGDFKVKKVREGIPMRRDSFIKVSKKIIKDDGAL